MSASSDAATANVGNVKVDFTTFHNVIDGRLEPTRATRHGLNPSTLDANPDVPVATPEDVDRAVSAARRALPGWAKTPVAERQQALLRYVEAVEAQSQDFATMMVQEQGKPVRSSSIPGRWALPPQERCIAHPTDLASHQITAALAEIAHAIQVLRALLKVPFADQVIEDSEDRRIVTQFVPIGEDLKR